MTFVNPEPLAPFADVIAAGEGEVLVPALVTRIAAADRPRRACCERLAARARLLRAVALRRAVRAPTARSTRFEPRRRRRAPPCRCARPRCQPTDAVDPPATTHLHARHRVRLAPARRGRARVREPVPLLLGRLQLPARARVPGRPHPGDRRRPRGRTRTGSASCRSRSAITRRSSGILARLRRDGLLDQPRVAASRRPDRADRAPAARRAASDRSRSRPRPAPIACAASSTRR